MIIMYLDNYKKEGNKKMELSKQKAIVEAVLFASGREVKIQELRLATDR